LNPLRVGTRGSALALWQAEWVAGLLRALPDAPDVELVTVQTLGDQDRESRLSEMGSTGVFTKALEDALVEERVDLCVHSLKDVETTLAPGTELGAFLPRADPRDALLSRRGETLEELAEGARVGTGSLRRTAWILRERPDLEVVPLRGNVPTRVGRLEDGSMDAMLLAAAGLKRLEMDRHVSHYLDPTVFLPAPGQGIVAVQLREGDERTRRHVEALDHPETRAAALAERTFLARLGGGCLLPVGAYATLDEGVLTLRGAVASVEGDEWVGSRVRGGGLQAESLGRTLADELLGDGAREILRGVRARTVQ
jgi:hydroxymethylbilane synthase